MGNFLDTPITEKETEVGEDGKCSYGLSAMQGWRAQMEDDHIQMLSVSDALPNVSLFGVFDGHGGDMVAHYSARHFPKHLTDALDAGDLKPDLAGFDGKAKAAFESSLMALDNELQHLQDVASGQDQSGSTSVQCLISPTSIVCANTGDSRAVLEVLLRRSAPAEAVRCARVAGIKRAAEMPFGRYADIAFAANGLPPPGGDTADGRAAHREGAGHAGPGNEAFGKSTRAPKRDSPRYSGGAACPLPVGAAPARQKLVSRW